MVILSRATRPTRGNSAPRTGRLVPGAAATHAGDRIAIEAAATRKLNRHTQGIANQSAEESTPDAIMHVDRLHMPLSSDRRGGSSPTLLIARMVSGRADARPTAGRLRRHGGRAR